MAHSFQEKLSAALNQPTGQRVLLALRALLRGRRNTPSGKRVLQRMAEQQQALEQQYLVDTWMMHARQTGIDIPQQSKKNLAFWREQATTYFAPEDLVVWRESWDTQIVPHFVLNHVTKDLPAIKASGSLKAVARRQDNNSHTGGGSARTRDVYMTLGLNASDTVAYWQDKLQVVRINIGKAYSEGKAHFPGLWLGSHISPQVSSGYLPTIRVGDTWITLRYTEEQLEIHYRYADASWYCYVVERKQQIFCAQDGVGTIFDGLFYQLLTMLRYLDKPTQDSLMTREPSVLPLRELFNVLFIPDVSLEAKDSTGLVSICSPYVSLQENTKQEDQAIVSLHTLIREGDFAEAQQLLREKPSLKDANRDNKTPILAALQSETFSAQPGRFEQEKQAFIEWLFSYGIDVALMPDRHTSVLGHLLGSPLTSQNQALLQQLLGGLAVDPALPALRCCPNLYQPQAGGKNWSGSSPLYAALSQGSWDYFLLLAPYIRIEYERKTLLHAAYHGKLQKVHFEQLIGGFACDIDSKDRLGQSVFLLAASKGDVPAMQLFAALGANVLLTDHKGDNALQRAIRAKSAAGVTHLLQLDEAQALATHHNLAGDSAYALALVEQAALTQAQEEDTDHPLFLSMFAVEVKRAGAENKRQQEQRAIRAIIESLEQREYTNIAYVKSARQSAAQVISAAAVLVTRQGHNGVEILLIRKKNPLTQGATGYWLFPGGLRAENEDASVAMRRECLEETSIPLHELPVPLYRWEQYHATAGQLSQYVELVIGHSVVTTALNPIANDDAGDAAWVPWYDVEQQPLSDGVAFRYRGVLISTSHALVARAICEGLPLQETTLNRALREMHFAKHELLSNYKNQDKQAVQAMLARGNLDPHVYPGLLLVFLMDEDQDWLHLLLAFQYDMNIPASIPSKWGMPAQMVLPLVYLISQRRFALAIDFIWRGADPNLIVPGSGTSALTAICAVYDEQDQSTQGFFNFLLGRTQLTGDCGEQAVLVAIKRKDAQLAKQLLDKWRKQLDINKKLNTDWGGNANLLRAAVDAELAPIVALLLAKRAACHDAQSGIDLWSVLSFKVDNFFLIIDARATFWRKERDLFQTPMSLVNAQMMQQTNVVALCEIAWLLLQHGYLPMGKYEKKQDDVVLYTEQRADGLFILLGRAGNGPWQLPMNPHYAPASATDLYTLYLPDSMSRHLLTRYYRVAAADEPQLMERWQSDNPDTRYVWVSAAQLQQQGDGYMYDNHPILYADALVAQSVYAGRKLPTWDTALSRAICETRQKPRQFVLFHQQRNDTAALARLARQGVVMDEATDTSALRPGLYG